MTDEIQRKEFWESKTTKKIEKNIQKEKNIFEIEKK